METVDGTRRTKPSSAWRFRGQDRLGDVFRRAVASAPRHAYILSGPSYSGKLTCAIEFGAALLCPNTPENAVPCHECSICRRIERGVFPDLSVFDLATQATYDNNSQSRNLTLNISTVRTITSEVSRRPSESKWKVVIVNDVETMQETAQEAFLKTLEEPPSYVVIVLLTTDADLLLPTILSRCVTIRMQRPTASTVAKSLIERGVDSQRADHIAARSDGLIGWAVRAVADPSMVESRAATRSAAREWIAADAYQRLVTATLLADRYAKDREGVFLDLIAVQRIWRDILHTIERVDSDHRAGDLNPRGLAPSPTSVVSSLRAVETCITDLEANVRPRLALQAMVRSWPIVTF